MKKKELLKRIEALESIVKPIADLQKASEKAKGLEGKKELEVGKWYKNTKCEGTIINLQIWNDNEKSGYGIHLGMWGNWGMLNYEDYTLATPQDVEDALIKEAKRRGFVNELTGNNSNIHNKKLKNCELFFKNGFEFNEKENTLRVVLDYETTWVVFKDGKWAEIVEGKQYTPKIGDVVKAWECDSDNDFMIGVLKQIDESDSPYYVTTTWCYKIEPITDENIIKLFN